MSGAGLDAPGPIRRFAGRAGRLTLACALCALLAVVLYAGHALIAADGWLLGKPSWQLRPGQDGASLPRRLARRARSASWRRPGARHARPVPLGHGPIGHADWSAVQLPVVAPQPWPESMPGRQSGTLPSGEDETQTGMTPVGPRPYIEQPRAGHWAAAEHQGAA